MYGSTMTAPLVSGKAQPHERIGYSAKSRPIRAAAVAQTRADFGFGSYRYFVGEPRGAYLELAYTVP